MKKLFVIFLGLIVSQLNGSEFNEDAGNKADGVISYINSEGIEYIHDNATNPYSLFEKINGHQKSNNTRTIVYTDINGKSMISNNKLYWREYKVDEQHSIINSNIKIKVSPNPIENIIHIKLRSLIPGELSIDVCNLFNSNVNNIFYKIIDSDKLDVQEDLTKYNLKKGVYLLKITNNNKVIVEKIQII